MSKKYALLVFFLLVPSVCLSDTIAEHNYQSSHSEIPVSLFSVPTHESLLELARQTLQKTEADGSVILSGIDQFIAYARIVEHPQNYLRTIFKMFGNKLKSCEFINCYELITVLNNIFDQLERYVKPERSSIYLRNAMLLEGTMFDRFQSVTNNLLYAKFSTEYETFKQDPELFLEHISYDIAHIAQEEVNIELMRQALIRFLETALSKVVWSPTEQEQTWTITKQLSHKLALLVERNILTDVNDLDDLFWSLVHRYCYFLDITTGMMHALTYHRIQEDVHANQNVLLELEEQDDFVERKIACLSRALIQAEIKTRAQEQGIIVK